MKNELRKRIFTSIFLLLLLLLMFLYTFVLIVSLIIIALIAWVEFYALISKIFKKNNYKERTLKFLFKLSTLIYLSYIVFVILFVMLGNPGLEVVFIYIILVSVMSDIGGLVVGKTFRGKKLTKISPNKTISGSLGSFTFSFFLVPLFIQLNLFSYNYFLLFVVTFIISFSSQTGDLIISLLKRKAKVKNTSDLLPGHGGILDRIDGIIFAIPIGFLLLI